MRVSLNRHSPPRTANESFKYPHRAARMIVTFPTSSGAGSGPTSAARASAVGHDSIAISVPVSTPCVPAGAGAAFVPTIATPPAIRHTANPKVSAHAIPLMVFIRLSSLAFLLTVLPSSPRSPRNRGDAGYFARRPFARTRTAAPMAIAAIATWIASTVNGVRFRVSGRFQRSDTASSPGSCAITAPAG